MKPNIIEYPLILMQCLKVFIVESEAQTSNTAGNCMKIWFEADSEISSTYCPLAKPFTQDEGRRCFLKP